MKKWVKFLLLFLAVVLLGVVYIGYQYWSITKFAVDTKPQHADTLIILGAAVWVDGPSPSLKARIEYAGKLYKDGYAPYIILSGGQGKFGPTEAEMMKQHLMQNGINSDVLLLEELSTNTYENIKNSYTLMQEHDLTSALIVTDTFHLKRAMLMANREGITTYGAPVFESVLYKNKSLHFYYTIREVLALTKFYFGL